MHLFNGKVNFKLRIQFTIISTIFFGASWCLSQGPGNYFWLCLSRDTYFMHLAIWLSLGLLIFALLYSFGRKSNRAEGKVILVLFTLCFLTLLDYGMRSIFGPVAGWPLVVLINWSLITLLYPAFAIFIAFKLSPSGFFIKRALQICIVPSLLLIYYALPSDFAVLKIEKPVQKGSRPPIHLILFDMLSYDFIFENHRIKSVYNNFESFSNEADVYISAFSPSGTTSQAIARLTTGIDLKNIGYDLYQWTAQTKDSVERKEISSYETLFSMASKGGYNVFLRAFALPYLNNFGEHIQSGKVYPFDNLWRAGMHSLIWPVLSPGGIQHQNTTTGIFNDYVTRIRTVPRNTFFYTHWNIPHDPFIYGDEGQKLNRIELTRNLITQPDRSLKYQHQLIGTDRILGGLIRAIKNSGTYDESLIIVTSDHNIKGYGFNMKHIPLLVKKPYQKKTNIKDLEVKTKNLLNFIKYFINEGVCNNSILEFGDKKYS